MKRSYRSVYGDPVATTVDDALAFASAPGGQYWTFTLPADPGTSGEVLITDGTGVSDWKVAVDATKLPLAGGTMSGDINMGTHDIVGVYYNNCFAFCQWCNSY